MKASGLITLCLACLGIILVQSCDKEEEGPLFSTHGSSSSHNNGQNCMNCHTNGPGEGKFIVAGSLYDINYQDPYVNGTVKLYSEVDGGGSLIAVIEGDAKGNFFTTANVDFSAGIFPGVTGVTGSVLFMPTAAASGQCNSCHDGVTTHHIGVE